MRATSRELVAVGVDVLAEAAHDLSETDMARAKAQTKVALLTALESSSSRAEQIARQTMIFGRVLGQGEVIAQIDALTLEDVRAGRRVACCARRRPWPFLAR